jgi:zinc protease
MKLFRLFFLGAFVLSQPAWASDKPIEKSFTLENGLKVVLYERHNLPLVQVVAAVNAGSKDETNETSGLVHLLEHDILFRGTEVRTGSEIATDIRKHGAYFNAHTGQDLALFEISLPSEYADFALANQKEILFNLKFDPAEIESEKEVVLEELNQIRDDPLKLGSALVYQSLFSGHPYGRPVFGNAEVIQRLKVADLERFYRAYFLPSNAALAVVGDFQIDDTEEKIRQLFGPLKKEDAPAVRFAKAAPPARPIEIEQPLDVQEAYLFFGAQAPDYNSPEQFAADVLTEILGRGINPLLYGPLKSPRDLVNTVYMSYIALKYGGAFMITLTLDPRRVDAAKNRTLQFLRQARNENYARDDVPGDARFSAFDYLGAAKNQISFDAQQAQENGLALAQSLAMHFLLHEGEESYNYLAEVKKVSSSDIRRAAAKYLVPSGYVVVSIVPRKK